MGDDAPLAESAGRESVPDFVAARDHVRDELVRFVRALRRAGASVPANAGTTAARALAEVGFADEARARVALRACLVTDRADRETFESLFSAFWRRLTAGLDVTGPAPRAEDGPDGGFAPLGAEAAEPGVEETDADEAASSDRHRAETVLGRETPSADETGETATARYSPTGARTRVSAADTGGEGFEAAFAELTTAFADLPGRRWGRGDEVPDVRRALRSSVATGGAVVEVPRREPRRTAVRACLLVDVSRSVLDVLDRSFLIRFLQRARTGWRDARVFFFDDDLREVSTEFDGAGPGGALAALSRAETEWGGGTRIGGSLASLRTEFPHAVDRRSVVVVVSDGLEMGDVSVLETEITRLSRIAGGVVWLNPLAVSPAYEPTARGMAAALPYLDGLFGFAGPDDLREMARQLRREALGGRVGYEYDPRRTERAATPTRTESEP